MTKDSDETDAAIKRLGAFAILTSEEMSEDKLLPMYYTRQQVEQVFDISKNYADLLPIRVQSEQHSQTSAYMLYGYSHYAETSTRNCLNVVPGKQSR